MSTSAGYSDHVKVLESALKEIYAAYKDKLEKGIYYKLKGGNVVQRTLNYYRRHALDAYNADRHLFNDLVGLHRDPSLEFFIFAFFYRLRPSYKCVCDGLFYDFLLQFFEYSTPYSFLREHFMGTFLKLRIEEYISRVLTKDPLYQILLYHRHSINPHAYICDVYIVEPVKGKKCNRFYKVSDPSSLFPGKYGIVAYCITLRDALSAFYTIDVEAIEDKFSKLFSRAVKELKDDRWLDAELWYGDSIYACSVERLKQDVDKILKKAEKIMGRYGIIRVAFPLD